jgi:GH15 family glucan-1,4-alpha-glucosidase
MTLGALLRCGYHEEAGLWRQWLLRAVAGDPADIQIMYAVDGARDLPERTLEHLPGYAGSRPVRVGNAAVDQRQGDVLGEVLHALHQARAGGVRESRDSWSLQQALLDHLVTTWREPDNGIWEIRGPLRHFTHSRALAWTAFDRGVRAVEEHGLRGDVSTWRRERDAIRRTILEEGVDHERGTFTQHAETREVDASLLVLPQLGFVAGDDPLMLGTVRAVEEDLLHDGLVLRYRTESGVDGLEGQEHPFLACSFWLVSAYADAGRTDDAHALFERLLALRNDVGLLAEEADPTTGRHAGNFPQALSHLTLVTAALDLARGTAKR